MLILCTDKLDKKVCRRFSGGRLLVSYIFKSMFLRYIQHVRSVGAVTSCDIFGSLRTRWQFQTQVYTIVTVSSSVSIHFVSTFRNNIDLILLPVCTLLSVFAPRYLQASDVAFCNNITFRFNISFVNRFVGNKILFQSWDQISYLLHFKT